MPQKRMECFRLLFDHLAWFEHQFLSDERDSRKAGNLWGMVRGAGGVRKSIHQSWLAKGLGLLYWGFKGVQEEIPLEEASTPQTRSVAFPPGQCTSPHLRPCHTLFDEVGHLDRSSASLSFRPCSVRLLVIPWAQRLSLWENWGDKRGYDKGHWHAHRKIIIWGLPEVVETVQVHCNRRRLLRRGLEFHVCTINKRAHMEKVMKLRKWSSYIHIYIYICVCVCVCVCVYTYIYIYIYMLYYIK